ncbi:MAG: hypothetical protein ABIG28_01565, partial [archaeon]
DIDMGDWAIIRQGFVGNPNQPDCNNNGIGDLEEILTEEDLLAISFPVAPLSPPSSVSKNRYLTITPSNEGQETAYRVLLPGDIARWVGPTRALSHFPGKADATPPAFLAANLQCEPYFSSSWGTGELQVLSSDIFPGQTYQIQAISSACASDNEGNYSPSLTLGTSVAGDLTGPYDPETGWPGPDGSINVSSDTIGTIDAFRGLSTAPRKARADIYGPDGVIDIRDIVLTIDAFRGVLPEYTISTCP